MYAILKNSLGCVLETIKEVDAMRGRQRIMREWIPILTDGDVIEIIEVNGGAE